MIQAEREIAKVVATKLRRAKIPFERQASLRGIQIDFLLRTTDGRKIVIDVKSWVKHPGFLSRALHQAKLYRQTIGADHAFVLVDSLDRSRPSDGVVNLDTLIPAIREIASPSNFRGARRVKKVARRGRGKGTSRPRASVPIDGLKPYVFAAMPFDQKYDDTYFVAMSHAAEKLGAVCLRVDKVDFAGDIVSEIHSLIRRAMAVITDLSEAKPNVLYEAGYAHALNIPTVHISATPLSELPFDVSHWNTLPYSVGRTHLLRDPLVRRLRAAIRLQGHSTNRSGT